MASVLILPDTNLLDVKLGHLPPWLAARDFSLCLHGALCRCYDRYYSKITSVGEWGLGGITMELAAWIYKGELMHNQHDSLLQ
uniref:Uncharacterized protein n=1 Tax=Strix occidentalis caurina TaxID=311401 RepID=A0A8D0KXV3_STROC